MNAVVPVSVLLILAAGTTGVADEPSAEQIAARETAFSEMLSDSVLTGSFTVDGKTDGDPLKEERYEIQSVTKAVGNLWTFTTRVKYGDKDITLPITVPVVWAGDTPMVSLTNETLPGLGAGFSARVLFYEGRYVGTWQHGKVGGHMFGHFEKRSKSNADSKTATDQKK